MDDSKRMMGIDYGSKRIGVAVSDPLNIIAQGLCVVPNNDRACAAIREIVRENNVKTIVIGMPLGLRGIKSRSADSAEEFARALEECVSVPVIRQDERFTTTIAHQTLRMMNTRKSERKVKNRIDIMAAALILQSYLDRLNSSIK